MSGAMVRTIARQQWRLLLRDRRLAVLSLALLVVLCTAAISAAATHRADVDARAAAQAEEARVWASQGPVNPHGAAHFGRYVYKPSSPLATIDPGLTPELGNSLFLEAHASNPARGRSIDGGTALDRFSGVNPASMLQLVAPLLIILAGFATFAGEPSRVLLRQELAAGISPSALVIGRLAGLTGTAGLLLLLVAAGGAAAIALAGGSGADYLTLLWILLGYGLYLSIFAALTLAASAAFASARSALVLLLAFWVVATLLVPRIAPAVAEALVPTLSGPAQEAAVTKEVREGPSGHDPQDARLERLKGDTLRQYGVSKIEDLPVDFGGISLKHGEALSTGIYRRHFAELYDAYDRQAGVQRLFALLSPLQAIRPWSAALAGNDQHAHRRFLEQAEEFRFATVQRLNEDIIHNRTPAATSAPYQANAEAITRGLSFAPQAPSLGETMTRHTFDLAVLVIWLVVFVLLSILAGRRLRELAA